METIQFTKKPSGKIKTILKLGLIVFIVTGISYLLLGGYDKIIQLHIINENVITILIVFSIVIFPLIFFMLPNNSAKESRKFEFSRKRDLVIKRKRKLANYRLNFKSKIKI